MYRSSWVSGLVLAGGAAASMMLGCATAGCPAAVKGGDLQVKVLAATSETPSNVALHLSVGDNRGQPVLGLTPANFRIFEDGKLVPEEKAKRMLLDPKVAEAHFTVLLVDMSGPIVESEDFPELVRQLGQFMELLKPSHQLTVSLFDGRDDLRTVLEPDETNLETALARVRRYRPEDRKSNLNGAILKGLAMIDRQLAASDAVQKSSNLVVFTDRGDLATRVPEEELEVALDKTPADVYVIAAGPGIKRPELGKIARTDAFYSERTKELGTGFTQLGKHLEITAAGHYLLSYCSPKRKGEHEVEVEIVTETEHGKLTHKFSANGFRKGCTPKHRPAFAEKGTATADKGADKGEGAAVDESAAAAAPVARHQGKPDPSPDRSPERSDEGKQDKEDKADKAE